MKGKTLEQKISLALYGTAIFFAFLFALGLILKTDLFNHWPTGNEVYEIGRDSLTLTAYFLAPATALLLFSDWRLEHVEKSREQQGKEIYNLVKQVDSYLKELESEVEDEDNVRNDLSPKVEEVSRELIKQLSALQQNINEFSFDDEPALAFKKKVEDVLNNFRENYFLLTKIFSVLVKKHNPSKYNTEYLGEDNDSFVERQNSLYEELNGMYVENFGNNYHNLNEIRELHDQLKVKVESPK